MLTEPAMIASNPDSPITDKRPRFLWWRFALVIAVLSAFAVGFCAAWYCDPPPTLYQQVIFLAVLIFILIQTVQAGWYRNNNPWELDIGLTILTIILVAFLVMLVIGAIVFIVMFVNDPIAAMFLLVVLFILVAVIWSVLASEGSKG
jgi:hypothetical protein